MQAALQQSFDATVTVENKGINGSTVLERLAGQNPYTAPYIADSAQIVTGNWAINDLRVGESVAAYKTGLISFVSNVRAAGKIVVLEEPNPVVDNPNLSDFVAAMDEVAGEMNVPIVKQYDAILALPNWKTMLTDGTHPGDALYAIKAANTAAVLAPIVRSLR